MAKNGKNWRLMGGIFIHQIKYMAALEKIGACQLGQNRIK